jgi:ADP-L-glycero-D-manno-heptose 6-epimerase
MSNRLLVTGAAGFIGARFVESLAKAGYGPPVSVDRADVFSKRPEHAGVAFGEIVDMDQAFTWLAAGAPLAGIVHLGACTDTTELDVAYLKRVNLEYSQRLWQVARERGIPFVYASSAATYGDGQLGYADDEAKFDRLKPLNPYGDSKLHFDQWALEEEREGRAPRAWSGFKFFNVYGFGERHKGNMASVVLKAYDQIKAHGKVTLFKSHHKDFKDGEQQRDFVYVDDVVQVLHFALRRPLERGVFNLGTGQARTFLDLVRATFRELGAPERIEFVDTPESIRDRYQYFTQADMGRLRQAGYAAPFHTLEEGVRAYVARLRAFDAAGKPAPRAPMTPR